MFSQSRTLSSRKSDFVVLIIIKRVLKGIHDRVQKDLRYRHAQLKADRTEEKCIEVDELAPKSFTYLPSTEEFERLQKNLVYLSEHTWQKCTDETPIRLQRSNNKRCTVFTGSLEKSDLH